MKIIVIISIYYNEIINTEVKYKISKFEDENKFNIEKK